MKSQGQAVGAPALTPPSCKGCSGKLLTIGEEKIGLCGECYPAHGAAPSCRGGFCSRSPRAFLLRKGRGV